MRRTPVVVCALICAACSSGRIDVPEADASRASAEVDERSAAILRHIESLSPFAGALARDVELMKRDDGFVAIASGSFSAKAPRIAAGAIELRHPTGARVSIRDVGARAVAGSASGGAIVYADAFAETDLVQVLGREGVEELRVLRSAAASADLELRIDVDGEVTAEDGRWVVRDGRGASVFATEPALAIDAHGTRRDLTISLRREGASYVASAHLDVTGLVHPIVVDPIWKSVGTTTARASHAAALLAGKVLAAGGVDTGGSPITSAIWFDGTSVSTAPSLAGKRQSFSLLPLGSTKLVAIGGSSGTAPLATVEIFDGTAWSAGASLANARYGHASVVLGSGVIVTTGGYGTSSLVGDAEQFNGTTWSAAGTLLTPRYNHAAVAYKAGAADRVLVVGGYDTMGSPTALAEVWDGATWKAAASMSTPRANCTATLLGSGKILVTGGRGASAYLDSGEVYDPVANSWTPVANKMASPRADHAAVLLAADAKKRVLVAGGSTTGGAITATTDLYDPSSNTFTASPSLNSARSRFTLTAMTPASSEVARVAAIGGISGPGSYATFVDLFAPKADGAACAVASDCLAPNCTGGLCCNAASCAAGYTCATGVCATSCSTPGPSPSCAAGYYCTGSVCAPSKSNGASCAAAHECASGFCADGVCCNSACTGQCEVCSATGVCNPAFGAPKGTRPACVGTAPGTTCGISCNGVDRTACQYPDATVSCGMASCTEGSTGGVETDPGKCNGSGTCSAATKACGAYKCGATACKATCASDGDCEGGYHCDTPTSKCIPDLERGKDCASSSECGKLTCVDGKCCGSTSCAAGETCAYPSKEGSCVKKEATTCASDAECGSGHCVDGVCCNSACGGQCEACDVTDHVGICTPVGKGDPHGTRAKCDAKSADDCARAQCDGKVTDRCAGFANGGTVSCGADSCTADGKLQAHGACDGAGGCLLPMPASCAEYACDGSKGACRTSCATTADCAASYLCDPASNKCIQGAHCSADGSASIDKAGNETPCAPYVCGSDGTCRSDCTESTQCTGGATCDIDKKTCTTIAGEPAGPDCGCHVVGATRDVGWTLAALAALGLVRRRSRVA